MNAKDENLLVKVVKKAVGLPTGNSTCGCSATVPAAKNCCSDETTERTSTDCGCAGAAVQDQEETHAAQA